MKTYIHCVFVDDGEERLTRHYLIQIIIKASKKNIGFSNMR